MVPATTLRLLQKKPNTSFIESKNFKNKLIDLRAAVMGNGRNVEFYIMRKEYVYQLFRHCYDAGRFTDDTLAGTFLLTELRY